MAGNEEWRENADTHKMDPGDRMRAAGVEQSKRLPGHNLQQRSKLPFSITTIALSGLLLSATIGYMVLYTKRRAEAVAMDFAKEAAVLRWSQGLETTGILTPESRCR